MAVLVFLMYFYTVLVIEKKRNLAPRVHENTPFDPIAASTRLAPSALDLAPQLQLLDRPMISHDSHHRRQKYCSAFIYYLVNMLLILHSDN